MLGAGKEIYNIRLESKSEVYQRETVIWKSSKWPKLEKFKENK